jgi:hypothetical protein
MRFLLLLTVMLVPALADVEDRSSDTKTFPGGRLVILDNVNGSIEAIGYEGNDVRLEVSKHIQAESAERLDAAKREVKLDMQQSGDTVKLYVDGPFRCNGNNGCGGGWRHEGYSVQYDFKLRVPSAGRVDLYTVNHGDVIVRGIGGGFDVRNVNGRIEMTDVAGAGRAHTVNGPVKVVFAKNPTGPSSFETVNGDIDIAFRKGLAADVRMQTMHGGMYTDFEVSTLPAEPAAAERQNGKYVYRRGGSTGVRVGAGGAELKLKTLNGDIFVRDREKK